jgi:hypothetical protein
MIQWIVGEGSASHYFADLAIAGTFPPSNGGILPANSTYLLWYVLCPDQHTLVIVPIALANALAPAAIQDGTADTACRFAVGIADTACTLAVGARFTPLLGLQIFASNPVGVRFKARARLNVSIYFWDVRICGRKLWWWIAGWCLVQ